ncbi:hypothetical protein Patl1_22385 [Pistacia atlantica]|uniref:Uncharacterized protein n=1 Tax=Pistacia atlantica TaxID=434234 RepID=A0ACC1A1I0_9ROSI|nr:hypothetical protein Patl1_22385 [Pistacia atlantica]
MERKSCCGSSYSSCGSTPKMQTTPVQGKVSKKEKFVKPEVITKNEAAQAAAAASKPAVMKEEL